MQLILAQASVNSSNGNVSISFNITYLITWLIIGFIAGALAELLVRGRGRGIFTNIIVGLIGAIIGGFLFSLLHLSLPAFWYDGITLRYIDILVAFIGAVILLILLGLFFRRRP